MIPALPARFIGVDLAWGGDHNNTALAVLEYDGRGAALVAAIERCGSDDEIIGLISNHLLDTSIVALDAPTIVNNVVGARPADTLMQKVFARQQAGTQPVNRSMFPAGVRGEQLVYRLGALGVDHTPFFTPRSRGRRVIEVYPHAAMVVLFRLPCTLKYKARGNRSYEDRYNEFRRYRAYMLALEFEEPPLRHDPLLEEVFDEGIADLRGGPLKRREDLWDAVLCAYVGLYHWYWGPVRSAVVGDLEDGYVVVPADDDVLQQLKALGTNQWPALEAAETSPHRVRSLADMRRGARAHSPLFRRKKSPSPGRRPPKR